MPGQDRLRQDYLRRVCDALAAYVARDAGRVHIHSHHCDAGSLDVTFTIDDVDAFHDLCEGRTPPLSHVS